MFFFPGGSLRLGYHEGTALLSLVPQNSESPPSSLVHAEVKHDVISKEMIENSEHIHYSYGCSKATDRGKNDIELVVL